MWTVDGTLDGEPYSLVWADLDGSGGEIIAASASVRALLIVNRGREVKATPTGPSYAVDASDAKSVLAALCEYTQVEQVTGDAPVIAPPLPPGSIG